MNSEKLETEEVVKYKTISAREDEIKLEANNIFEEIIIGSKSQTKCGEITYSDKHFELLCHYCQKKFVKIKSFLSHFLKLHLNLEADDFQLVLDELLDEDQIAEKETVHILNNEAVDILDERLALDEVSIKEEVSSEEFDETALDIFEADATANKSRCGYCAKIFRSKSGLQKHMRSCRKKPDEELSENLTLECKYRCGRTFQRKCDLSHHENHKHNSDGSIKVWTPKIKTYICETCGNCYQRKHYLIQHQRIHTGERPYSCSICAKTFTKRNNLTLHMRHHSKERKFKCQYCGKGLTDANKLRMHEMIHTGLYPFQCNICDKKFPCKSKLNVHIKKHINDRIYKCDLCDKRFLDSETLKGHAAVHSDEKPFACEICPARFPRKGALRLHMNLHNDKKKYTCKICRMEFHQYNGIYSHYKRHGIKYSMAYENGEVDGISNSTKEDE